MAARRDPFSASSPQKKARGYRYLFLLLFKRCYLGERIKNLVVRRSISESRLNGAALRRTPEEYALPSDFQPRLSCSRCGETWRSQTRARGRKPRGPLVPPLRVTASPRRERWPFQSRAQREGRREYAPRSERGGAHTHGGLAKQRARPGALVKGSPFSAAIRRRVKASRTITANGP